MREVTDHLHVPDAALDEPHTIYLRIGAARLAFESKALRELIEERGRMCGWRRDGDGWVIPANVAEWYADRRKEGGKVESRDQYRSRVRESHVDWWKSYDGVS